MKIDYTIDKLKKITAEVILIGVLAIAGNSYYNFLRDIRADTREMTNLMKNSPRIEYIVKEGDRLNGLRDKFFPIDSKEFKSLDSQYLANWGSYKELSADNIWTDIVRKKNKLSYIDCLSDMYQTHTGDTLKIPIRKW